MSLMENFVSGGAGLIPNLMEARRRSIVPRNVLGNNGLDYRKNELLAQLSAPDLARLSARSQVIRFEPGQTIYPADHLIDSVYFPLTAVASRLTILEDGSTVEVGLIGRDGLIGLPAFMGRCPTRNWTVVDIEGSAIRLRVSALREALEQVPLLNRVLSTYYHDFFTQVSRRAVCRSRHSIVEQFCTWLLMVRDRTDSAELPLTQEGIARRMGSRRAGITVAANALKKSGAINYWRGHIVIADREMLQKKACECYAAICDQGHDSGRWLEPINGRSFAVSESTAA